MGKKLVESDYVGRIFGKLTVISFCERKKNERQYAECLCECGNSKIVSIAHLMDGGTRSCGCDWHKGTHGIAGSRIYRIWHGMKVRCYKKTNHKYKYYGAKGVIICKEWLDNPLKFKEWALSNGYSDDLSIDRIDNDGNYEPSNCKWSTNSEQGHNMGMFSHNTSGVKGVYFSNKSQKWIAQIKNNNKSIHLGSFDDIHSAEFSRKQAELKYWSD